MKYLMSSSGDLDLSIVLSTGKYDASVLSDAFLKAKGVIPNEWQLAQPGQSSSHSIELLFKNGVRITGQPGAIRFVESMVEKAPEALIIPQVVRKFVETVPSVEFRSVGLNPRRYGTFPGEAEGSQRFMNESLFTSAPWQTYGKAPVRSNVFLGFTLDRCLLRLNIQEARLQLHGQEPVSAVLFMGNYHYAVSGETAEGRLTTLDQILEALPDNLAGFQDLVDHQFLGRGLTAEVPQPPPASEVGSPLKTLFNRFSPQPSGA